MGYDRTAPPREVHVTINGDLVQRALVLTTDLSATVEHLLAEYVAKSDEGRAQRAGSIAEYIAFSDQFAAEHGSLTDDYPSL